ncbi:sugar phosphate isomerase/epimerase family protein [Streptomyces sp. NPDC057697]|uniref:sugar phosphate isomerase/epimerase family protein n=1 Tax=Streptomyces sp. NPDC057697 TaxID=3346219 RepID=UPI003688E96D
MTGRESPDRAGRGAADRTPDSPQAAPAPVARPGICSVTFRRLPAAEVARLAADAGLAAVEWGADVHAPPEDPDTVRAARDASLRYGLTCCSYGSYFRAAPGEAAGFPGIARAAALLGAPRVRVWAGGAGSGDATPRERSGTAAELREAARIAADHGLDLALEFHGGTLTDTVGSTVRLLDEVGADNLRTYWQPPQNTPDEEALAGLRALVDRVDAVHVFSWWPGNHRLPLADRAGLWAEVFALLNARRVPLDALLEFVPGDDPAVLPREADTLRRVAARR